MKIINFRETCKLIVILMFFIFSSSVFPQTVTQSNLDDVTWTYCDPTKDPNCVGISKAATGYQSIVNSPSLDGTASLFHIENATGFGAVLWYLNLNNFTPSAAWRMDYYIYISDLNFGSQAIEVDANQGLGSINKQNYRIVYGTECNLNPKVANGGGHWRFFQWQGGPVGQGKGAWIDTGIPCSYLNSKQQVINNHWFHVCIAFYAQPNTNNAVFTNLFVQDVTDPKNPITVTNVDFTQSKNPLPAFPPQPIKYPSTLSTIDMQLDTRDGAVSYDTYFDEITVTRSSQNNLPSCIPSGAKAPQTH